MAADQHVHSRQRRSGQRFSVFCGGFGFAVFHRAVIHRGLERGVVSLVLVGVAFRLAGR
jgi:hypothetical protein